ncbi:MAG: hypothetical protein WBM17_16285 [Anaerolineales bacterium]
MENTRTFNPESAFVARSAFLIDKVHRCADCPIRKLAIQRPQSIFARLHNWHKNWWPGWKAHQTPACPYGVSVKTQS